MALCGCQELELGEVRPMNLELVDAVQGFLDFVCVKGVQKLCRFPIPFVDLDISCQDGRVVQGYLMVL